MKIATRGIILPRGTDTATCHNRDLTRDNKKILQKKNKKIKKNQRVTRGLPLKALIIFS